MAKQFLRKDNVTMLWEVVNDESIFKFLPPEQQRSVHQTFLTNLEGFCEAEVRAAGGPHAISVLDMNKKYIMLLLNHVRSLKTPNRIRIQPPQPSSSPEPPPTLQPPQESVLAAQVQQQRKQKMDLEYLRAKQNFDDLVQVKAPPPPNFQDDLQLSPIGSNELEEYARLRDQDMQQFYSAAPPPPSSGQPSSSEWLTPTETSIKAEKKSVSFSDPPPLKLKPKRGQEGGDDAGATALSFPQYDVYEAPATNLQLTFEEKEKQMPLANQFLPEANNSNTNTSESSVLDELRNEIRTIHSQLRDIQHILSKFTTATP